MAFFEAIRQLKQELNNKVLICFLTFLVYYQASKELKTKPTQVAVKQLMSFGIKPDILFARSEHPISKELKKKIANMTSVYQKNIIFHL